ncbi:MAG: iron-containing alcohol dehydrogenase [Betaproteobacteria bacterium]|jgi:4-hydroxybutyrate dehydrogenase|nr:iron-containing alcohol dehydrogenase [Rhodocyclaceae bacterium]MCA3133483.1 iron-containing alcohol dehydrogenase [Rhodocyclaceae bacterium]MCA3141417.1 iron-containing alcohol dehydrogenase [Rhodocyclaceae bacterium]MCA3145748.1 iron-containing alcohol dehydrogenase [Rhodocyclaceae bacterium]MCE2897982.1 iron-containing alcohol dehydrogenase [Betaproteobacteria bacterium]
MATIQYLTTVQFDHGAVKLAGAECQRLGITRPLVVTDSGVRAAGLLARVEAHLEGLPVTVYDGTPANPTEAAVLEAVERYRAASADGLLAVGGGSSIDLAKAVALLATHPQPLVQYAAVEGGVARITAAVAPLVAIPTTAGTGSEVGRASVVVLKDGRKLGFLSPHLLPKVALCDPELTLGLPPLLTAATGMDAMAHCIETFLSPLVNPPAEAIALDGLVRAGSFLERATRDGSDREARWNMMMAAMEGALAFQKGLGAVHALSHPLGALHDLRLHHGTLNAVLLPPVLRFNAGHVGDKLGRIALALGLSPGADVPGAITGLNARLGLPAGLKSMGVPHSALEGIAAAATKDHCHATNPRLASAADYLGLLQEAFI